MKEDIRITFIDPITSEGYSSEGRHYGKPESPHMGLIYMATYLSSHYNAKVNIIDMSALSCGVQEVKKIVESVKPHLVGFTSKTFNILGVYELAKVIKSALPESIIIAGGAHPTALPEQTLSECENIDAVVRVEGELTVAEIVERYLEGYRSANDLFTGVKGITFRKPGGGLCTEPNRDLILDLDGLPFPDFSLVDYNIYNKVYNPVKRELQHRYPVFASRGCPFNCTFCMPLLTRKWRVRNTEAVVEEVSQLHQKWGVKYIYFEDSLFCSDRKWFEDFCQKYTKKGLHRLVNWGFEIRIDRACAYPHMFELAKEAGCIYTFFGIESGSELILEKAHKRFKMEQILQAVEAARKAGIAKIHASFILGLPYETIDTIRETFGLVEVLPIDRAAFYFPQIYPMTDLFKMAENREGGLRWIPGRRMNWACYARSEPQVTVNDLTEKDLLRLTRKASQIITWNRMKRSYTEFALEYLAYFVHYLQNDRKKLLSKLKKAAFG